MRRAIALFLLFLHLTAATQFHELLKMPLLVAHYMEHLQEGDEQLSFVDFLHRHYSDHHKDDLASEKHHNKHDNLPFKSSCCGGHAPVFLKPEAVFAATEPPLFANAPPTYSARLRDRIFSRSTADIWQPPRLS